jgi:integrase
MEALTEHRSKQRRQIIAAGRKYRKQEYIFANTVGEPLDPSRVSKRWKVLLKAAGLPPFRLYDARHTHATHLLLAGENPKVIQERLGHASVTLTLDTYSHVIPAMQAGTVDRLEALYAQAS